MNQSLLFNLHPMAWAHAQQILQQEIAMLKQGIGKKKRAAFLYDECNRLIAQSEVTLTESLQQLVSELSRADLVFAIDDMRKRFEFHGFKGTLRSIRNSYRAVGFNDPGLDGPLVACAIETLRHDDEFMLKLNATIETLLQTLENHPKMEELRGMLVGLQENPMLPSLKEQQAFALVLSAFNQIDPKTVDWTPVSIRDVVSLRARLLSVELPDILSVVLQAAGVSGLQSMMVQSREIQLHTYRTVLATIIDERLDELEGVSGQTQPKEQGSIDIVEVSVEQKSQNQNSTVEKGNDQETALLTTEQVMSHLKVSKSTVYRLRMDGALETVNVRRSIRFTQASVERYLRTKL